MKWFFNTSAHEDAECTPWYTLFSTSSGDPSVFEVPQLDWHVNGRYQNVADRQRHHERVGDGSQSTVGDHCRHHQTVTTVPSNSSLFSHLSFFIPSTSSSWAPNCDAHTLLQLLYVLCFSAEDKVRSIYQHVLDIELVGIIFHHRLRLPPVISQNHCSSTPNSCDAPTYLQHT